MIESLTKLNNPFGDWYTWREICDGCYATIYDYGFVDNSCKPDTVKAHFCIECLRFMLDARDRVPGLPRTVHPVPGLANVSTEAKRS